MSAYENARRNLSGNVSKLIAATNGSCVHLAQLMGLNRKVLCRARTKKGNADITLRNAGRIAEHFGIEVSDLYAPHDAGWAERIVSTRKAKR